MTVYEFRNPLRRAQPLSLFTVTVTVAVFADDPSLDAQIVLSCRVACDER